MAFLQLLGNKFKAGGYLPFARAKLMELRRLLSIQGLKQGLRRYCLPDGTDILVSKNYRNELIQIIAKRGAAGDLIFLIVSSTEYAVWRVKDAGATLIPNGFNLGAYTTLFYIHDNKNPSVVKSNDGYSHGYYTVENIRVDTSYFYPFAANKLSQPQYGRLILSRNLPGGEEYVAIGVRNCWIEDSFDNDISYLSETVGNDSDYICSGRNSAYIDEAEGQIKNLHLWKINNTSGQIKYEKKRNGSWSDEDGVVVGYQADKQRDIYAVLSPDKYVGVDNDSYEETTDSDCPYPTGCDNYFDYVNGYRYRFGDVVFDEMLGVHNHSETKKVASCTYTANINWGYTSGKITILDYDNVDVDETFICIYTYYSPGEYSYGGMLSGTGAPLYGDLIGYDGQIRRYKLKYRLNSGSVITIDICDFVYGSVLVSTGRAYQANPCNCWIVTAPYTYETRTYGTRVSSISCQVTDKYLLYSYTLWDYLGPANENHLNDQDDDSYTFNKRILGIIDRETGLRTEHEVDDDLLGNLYTDSFDKEKASAVGLHRKA